MTASLPPITFCSWISNRSARVLRIYSTQGIGARSLLIAAANPADGRIAFDAALVDEGRIRSDHSSVRQNDKRLGLVSWRLAGERRSKTFHTLLPFRIAPAHAFRSVINACVNQHHRAAA